MECVVCLFGFDGPAFDVCNGSVTVTRNGRVWLLVPSTAPPTLCLTCPVANVQLLENHLVQARPDGRSNERTDDGGVVVVATNDVFIAPHIRHATLAFCRCADI